MAGSASVKGMVKRFLLGGDELPQQVPVALCDPQREIAVWLYSWGAPRDVTHLHSIACAAPMTVCLPFKDMEELDRERLGKMFLEVRERAGAERLLGKIELSFRSAIQTETRCLGLFYAISCASYCMPKTQLWANHALQAYSRRREKRVSHAEMTSLDIHSMEVLFLCPRPAMMVTTMNEEGYHLFPMYLMGSLTEDYFAFALNGERFASEYAKTARRVALSAIPFAEAEAVQQLGKRQLKSSGDWNELPFEVKHSKRFELPVPQFAVSVREIELEVVKDLGSHTFFAGRLVQEMTFAHGPQFYVVHGMYQRTRAI